MNYWLWETVEHGEKVFKKCSACHMIAVVEKI